MFRSAERFKRENINLVLLPAAGRDGGGAQGSLVSPP